MDNVQSTGQWLRSTVIAVGMVLALSGCATGPQMAPSPELLNKIERAHTRYDHEELAAYYDKAAKEARATAEGHRKTAKSYQSWQATGAGRGGSGIYSHCNALAAQYDKVAEEYAAMAAAHRQLAQQANH